MITQIPIDHFLPWLTNKLDSKFAMALQGLYHRFVYFLQILRRLRDYLDNMGGKIEEMEESGSRRQWSVLINNCCHLVDRILDSHPLCLDLDYCETFLNETPHRLVLIKANFHPLLHIDFLSKATREQLNYNVNSCLDSLDEQLESIKIRAIYSGPVLQLIQETMNRFQLRNNYLVSRMKEHRKSNVYPSYQKAFVEFSKSVHHSNNLDDYKLIQEMIQLTKVHCIYQNKLEHQLKYTQRLSLILKQKGKKMLDEQLKIEVQQKVIKYAGLCLKSDFVQTCLSEV